MDLSFHLIQVVLGSRPYARYAVSCSTFRNFQDVTLKLCRPADRFTRQSRCPDMLLRQDIFVDPQDGVIF